MSINARGLIDILPGKLFYTWDGKLAAKLINCPDFLKVAYALRTSACIILAKDDEPPFCHMVLYINAMRHI